MDDKILALLGDRSAQERITERGELLPCVCTGNETAIRNWNTRAPILSAVEMVMLNEH